MSIFHTISNALHFALAMNPELQRYAKPVHEDEERTVYSYDEPHSREILDAVGAMMSGIAGVVHLLRLLVIGLIAEYDVFLSRLVRLAFTERPAVLGMSQRVLTYKELAGFSTLDEARDFVLEKEIDSLMMQDHLAQLKEINKSFDLKVNTEDDNIRRFLEICERCNLFTHAGGIVNAKYVTKCQSYGVDTAVEHGTELGVSAAYYSECVSTVSEICIKLCQYIWRKLKPSDRDAADVSLNEAAFSLIRSRQYRLAERILDYGINHTGKGSERTYRMMVVNYANAIKLGGDKERAFRELDRLDWSATGIDFQVCVAGVRDDIETLRRLMPIGHKSEALPESSYRSWPVFRSVRNNKEFQGLFKAILGRNS
jgi:hypothetical protein